MADSIWSDPTAAPYYPDSAAMNFGLSPRPAQPVPDIRPTSAPFKAVLSDPALSDQALSDPPAPAAAAPGRPRVAAGRPGRTTAGPDVRVGGVAAARPGRPGGLPGRSPRRRPFPQAGRNEPRPVYQPVTTYRSEPGVLTGPSLDQVRRQTQQGAPGRRSVRSLSSARSSDDVRRIALTVFAIAVLLALVLAGRLA